MAEDGQSAGDEQRGREQGRGWSMSLLAELRAVCTHSDGDVSVGWSAPAHRLAAALSMSLSEMGGCSAGERSDLVEEELCGSAWKQIASAHDLQGRREGRMGERRGREKGTNGEQTGPDNVKRDGDGHGRQEGVTDSDRIERGG